MALEALIADLDAQAWRVWHLGTTAKGSWTALLYTERPHPAVQDAHNRHMGGYRGGFSRHGKGATPIAALYDAARDFLQPAEEQDVDLASLLR